MHALLEKIKTRYQINKTSTILLLASFTVAMSSLFITNLFSNISSYWSVDIEEAPPIPDLFFEIFNHRLLTFYVDTMMNLFVAATMMCILFRRDAIKIYFRVFVCLSITYFLRMSLITITNLPSPNDDCIKIVRNFLTSFTYNRCGDLMFSGHTLMVSICVFTWHSYRILNDKRLSMLACVMAWVTGVVILLLILVSRNHYTVDVLLGFYITGCVWIIYGFVWDNFLSKEPVFKNIIFNQYSS